MFEFEKPRIEIAEQNETYGRFVVEPLERGYGTTLGNSLRRILLSSLPGAAVSNVKIDGVLHEFSTIPGVKEDVTEIILNLKNLAIKNNSESNEPKMAYIEILNPDLHIATLSGGADSKLFMEITITKGRGYVEASKNKRADQPLRMIPVDSLYTPVRRVNFKVEDTRVGQITDYDKLTFEVWTDGTISPDDAVSLGAKILNEHLCLFVDLSDSAKNAEILVEKEVGTKEKVLEQSIE